MRFASLVLLTMSLTTIVSADEVPRGVVGMKPQFESPIVIGHRGASGYAPEHSTESAAMAHVMGADYIEQDCVLSRDGVPIVMHDFVLDDLSDVASKFPGRNRSDGHWYVCDFTLEELRALRMTERRSPNRAWKDKGTRFPLEKGHFRVATLAEHLELIQGLNQSRGRTAGVYVEIKEPKKHRENGLDASTAILKVLTEYGYDRPDSPIFLQCFEREEVIRIRKELKSPLPLIYLLGSMPKPEAIQEASTFCDGLGVLYTLVVSGRKSDGRPEVTDLVATAHQHGLQVHVWTFRSDALPPFADRSDELLNWLAIDGGVDGIFSDQPDLVVQWRNEQLTKSGRSSPFRLLNNKPESKP